MIVFENLLADALLFALIIGIGIGLALKFLSEWL